MARKILIIIRHPVGGIRTYLKYTYRYLDPDKYDLTIMTLKSIEGGYLKSELDTFRLRMIELDSERPELDLTGAICRLLMTDKFDIIHSQGFTAGVIAGMGNWLFRVPHVITPHGLFETDQFGNKFRRVKRWLVGRILARADVIQSVSHDAEENLLEFYPFLAHGRTMLKVIQNGIDIALFPSTGKDRDFQDLRRKLKLEPDTFLFGFLGRFMPEKGFEYLINAVEILSTYSSHAGRFKILAVNDGAYIREYRSIIQSKRLSEYFIFSGFVPDVLRILNGLDALVIPSTSEAFGLIAAEALLAGCPVIASNCKGLREVVKNTPALITQTRDAGSISGALKKFMGNSKAIRNETVRFMPVARERFDSRRTAAQLDSLFDELLTEKKRYRSKQFLASGQAR